jgi:RNA polymerase-binding transcription factor DksA
MATKRKAAPSRTKGAAPPKKKSGVAPKAAAPKAAKPLKAAKAVKAPAPALKAKARVVAVKPGKPVAPVKAAPGKGAVTAMKGAKPKLKAVPAADRQAVARPIGALPPSAVARAVKPSPLPAKRTIQSMPRPHRETTSDEGAQGVTEKDYQEFEQRLMDERKKLLKEMGHLENNVLKVNQRDSAGDLSGYSFHMADVGTDAMEREKAFLFASNEGHLLREIDDALRKIYGGEYGICEMCEKPIARARLEAVPYARLCKSCKEAEERASRGQS